MGNPPLLLLERPDTSTLGLREEEEEEEEVAALEAEAECPRRWARPPPEEDPPKDTEAPGEVSRTYTEWSDRVLSKAEVHHIVHNRYGTGKRKERVRRNQEEEEEEGH